MSRARPMGSGWVVPRMAMGTLTLALGAVDASAQERDSAAAQALFDQGRELVREGRYLEACPKFQESNRLDPGIGTQFHLADCHEQTGRVASAWATFLEVASLARASSQLEREKVALKRADKLQPRLPRLVVTVPEASQVRGLEVRRNGVLVGEVQWGTPVPVDPGEIEISASAPGRSPLLEKLRVEEGRTQTYSLPELALEPRSARPSPPSLPPPVSTAPPPVVPAPAPRPPTRPEHAQRVDNRLLIGTLVGVGVVGSGLGTAYALMARSRYVDSKRDCDRDNVNVCGPVGLSLRESARTRGDIATVSFMVGGGALIGAGLVWLLSGSSEEGRGVPTSFRPMPALAPGEAALSMQGRF